ncbi:MAG: BamA/TamA family outer membrane protein [candidate division Zixibacteria bacterium]|nr:BamA/TamA family outer membrane protein [candidate division Zixibacteria bacterium]
MKHLDIRQKSITVISFLLLVWLTAVPVQSNVNLSFSIGDSTTTGIIDLLKSKNPSPSGIGLALSGGGAQGFSQIGVLKVLEENNIPITHIAGTSIGGVIGGLYASGYSARDIERIALNTDWNSLFSNNPNRLKMFFTQRQQKEKYLLEVRFDGITPYIPQGLTAGQKISNLLYNLTVGSNYGSCADFDRLKIPFRAVATDLVTGDPFVFSEGDLAEAMRASVSVPLAFSPVEHGEKLLVDGGLVCPIPVEVLRDMGANKIVVINSAAKLYTRDKLITALDIANQATSVMVMDKMKEQLKNADLVIEPDLSRFANTAFGDIADLIKEGERAAIKCLGEIKELLNETQNDSNDNFIFADSKIIVPLEYNLDSDTENLCKLHKGRYVSGADLEDMKRRLWDSGKFGFVGFSIYSPDNEHRLEISLFPYPEIDDIAFTGNTIFSHDVLEKYLNVNKGTRLNRINLLQGLNNIENLYRHSRYPLINIVSVELDIDKKKLSININEGLIYDLDISGNNYTRTWVIKRDFPDVIGRPYNSRDIHKGADKLFNTGMFERVTTDIEEQSSGYYKLKLKMREKHPRAARFGVRYDDEYNLQGLAEIGDYNVLGTGNEYFARGIIGDREKEMLLEFRADRIFNTLFTYSLYGKVGIREYDIFIDHRPRKEYQQKFQGTGFKFGRQISRLGTASVELRIEDIEEEFPDMTEHLTKIRSIVLRSVVDTKDSPVFPERGKYHQSYLEWANDIIGGNEVYSKFYMSIESYYPLLFGFNFHPRAAFGISINGLPLSQQFRLGEPDGFSGFYSNENRGDNFFSYYLKLRKKIRKNYYAYIRYDSGRIYSDREDVKITNLRHSFGIGFEIATVLGPLNAGYGIYEENTDKFYISWGYLF